MKMKPSELNIVTATEKATNVILINVRDSCGSKFAYGWSGIS